MYFFISIFLHLLFCSLFLFKNTSIDIGLESGSKKLIQVYVFDQNNHKSKKKDAFEKKRKEVAKRKEEGKAEFHKEKKELIRKKKWAEKKFNFFKKKNPISSLDSFSNQKFNNLKSYPLSLENPKSQSVFGAYLFKVLQAIEKKKFYPKIAMRKNIQGVVHISFVVNQRGEIVEFLKVDSKHPQLNYAVRSLLAGELNLPPLPKELKAQTLELSLPIRFEIQN